MAVVGEAHIDLTIDFKTLNKNIGKQLDKAGKNIKKAGQRTADKTMKKFRSGPGKQFTKFGEDHGKKAGDTLADSILSLQPVLEANFRAEGELIGQDAADHIKQQIESMGDNTDWEAVRKIYRERLAESWYELPFPMEPAPRLHWVKMEDRNPDEGKNFAEKVAWRVDVWKEGRKPAPFEGMFITFIQKHLELLTLEMLIYGAIGFVMSLVDGLIAFTSSVLAAAPAVMSLGNVFTALLQGYGVLKTLFSGVGAALSAVLKAQKSTQKQVVNTVSRSLAQQSARLSLKKANLAQIRTQEDAVEKASDAETGYADALRAQVNASWDFGEAWRQATENVMNLKLALEGSALSEERAVLNVKKAEKDLVRARSGGTMNDIYQADLAYREQVLNLKKIRIQEHRLQEDSGRVISDATDTGPQILAAQENVKKAAINAAKALKGVKRAYEDIPIAFEEAALRVQAAVEALRKSLLPANQSAINQINAAMKELSPAAQKFVYFLANMVVPMLKDIKKAGQEKFFPYLLSGMQELIASPFPGIIKKMVEDTSTVLGMFSQGVLLAFTEPQNLSPLQNIFNSYTRIIAALGRIVVVMIGPALQIISSLASLAERMALAMGGAADRFSIFIDNAKDTGALDKFFGDSESRWLALVGMFKAFSGGVKALFEAMIPAADYLVAQITALGQQWSNTFTPEKMKDIGSTFQGSVENALKIIDLITDVSGWFFRMGADPNIGVLTGASDGITAGLESMLNNDFGKIADDIARIIVSMGNVAEAFSESQSLNMFFGVLSWVFKGFEMVVKFLSSAHLIAPAALFGIVYGLSKAGGWVIGQVLGLYGKAVALREQLDIILSGQLRDLFKGIGDDVGYGAGQVLRQAGQFNKLSRKMVPKARADAKFIAVHVMQGVIIGIENSQQIIIDAAYATAKEALIGFASAWQMASPSIVVTEQIKGVVGSVVEVLTVEGEAVVAAGGTLGEAVMMGAGGGMIPAQRAGGVISRTYATGVRAGAGAAVVGGNVLVVSAAAGAAAGGAMAMAPAGGSAGGAFGAGQISGAPEAATAGAATGDAHGLGAVQGFNGNKAALDNEKELLAAQTKMLPWYYAAGKVQGEALEKKMLGGGVMFAWIKSLMVKMSELGVAAVAAAALAGEGLKKVIKKAIFWGIDAVKGLLPESIKKKLISQGLKDGLKKIIEKGMVKMLLKGGSRILGKMAVRMGIATAAEAGVAATGIGAPIAAAAAVITTVGFALWTIWDIFTFIRELKKMKDEKSVTDEDVQDMVGDTETSKLISDQDVQNLSGSFLNGFAKGGPVLRKYLREFPGTANKFASAAGAATVAKMTAGSVREADNHFNDTLESIPDNGRWYQTPSKRESKAIRYRMAKEDFKKMLVRQMRFSELVPSSMGRRPIQKFASGGLVGKVPGWLTDPKVMRIQNDSSLNDTPFPTDWKSKESERLLMFFESQDKYKYLDINKYEDLFKQKLMESVERAYQVGTEGKDAVAAALAKKRAEIQFASYGFPQTLADDSIRKVMPTLYGEFATVSSYREQNALGVLTARTDGDAQAAQALLNQIEVTADFEKALLDAYHSEVAKKLAEEKARADADAKTSAAASTTATIPSSTTTTIPSASAINNVVADASQNKNYDSNYEHVYSAPDLQTLRASQLIGNFWPKHGYWHYPLKKRYSGRNYYGHPHSWGVDIAVPEGKHVLATQKGVIKEKGSDDALHGNYLKVGHEDGMTSFYGRLSKINSSYVQGLTVHGGAIMGFSGKTGGGIGEYLHYELHNPNDKNFNATVDAMGARGIPNIANRLSGTGADKQSTEAEKKRKSRANFAEGGIVAGTPDGIDSIIGEAGRDERVTQTDGYGRSSTEIEMLGILNSMTTGEHDMDVVNHIHVSKKVDIRVAADRVSRDIMFTKR